MRGLGLDPRLAAETADLADHPLGGSPFAVGGRGTLNLLQLLEKATQPVLVRWVRHWAATLPGTYHGSMSAEIASVHIWIFAPRAKREKS